MLKLTGAGRWSSFGVSLHQVRLFLSKSLLFLGKVPVYSPSMFLPNSCVVLQRLPDLKLSAGGRRWVKGAWRSQEWEEWEDEEPGWHCQREYTKQLVFHQLLTPTPSPLPVKDCRFNAQAIIAFSLAVKVLYTRHMSHTLHFSGLFSLFFGSANVVLWHCHFTEQRILAVPSSNSHNDAVQLDSSRHVHH